MPGSQLGLVAKQLGVTPGLAAEQRRSHAGEVRRREISRGTQQLERHPRIGGNRPEPESGADEDQSPDSRLPDHREVLGKAAAPRNAEYINGAVAELVEVRADSPRQFPHRSRPARRHRRSCPGSIERDRLDAELVAKSSPELEGGADPVDEEERAVASAPLYREPNGQPTRGDDLGPRRRHAVHRIRLLVRADQVRRRRSRRDAAVDAASIGILVSAKGVAAA